MIYASNLQRLEKHVPHIEGLYHTVTQDTEDGGIVVSYYAYGGFYIGKAIYNYDDYLGLMSGDYLKDPEIYEDGLEEIREQVRRLVQCGILEEVEG